MWSPTDRLPGAEKLGYLDFLFDVAGRGALQFPLENGITTVPRQNIHSDRGTTVNKNDLIAAVSSSAGLSKADSAKAVDSVFDSIASTLSGGSDVRLVGFGTFSVANRKASEGRNPRTGERIQIPASKQAKFKAGKALKDAVNS